MGLVRSQTAAEVKVDHGERQAGGQADSGSANAAPGGALLLPLQGPTCLE